MTTPLHIMVFGVSGAQLGHFGVEDADTLRYVQNEGQQELKRALDGRASDMSLLLGSRALEARWLPLRGGRADVIGAVLLIDAASRGTLAEQELSQRRQFQNLILRLSSHLIDLRDPEIDQGIQHALEAIGTHVDADRAYVFRFSEDSTVMVNTHEWCAPGVESQIDSLQARNASELPWWTERLRRHEVICVPRVRDLGVDAAAEKAVLLERSTQSVAAVPLLQDRRLEGFVGFDVVRAEKTWTDDDIVLLGIVGKMLVMALYRQRAAQERRALQMQLIQARSLENVSKLAGGVAHDFNNYLAVILNYATLIQQRAPDGELRTFASELLDSATQAADLTRQLLITGRRGQNEPMVLDLNEVLESLERLVRRTLGELVTLTLKLDSSIGLIRIGRAHLEQAVLNLVLNARDAMPTGGAMVIETGTVERSKEDAEQGVNGAPGRYAACRLTDTGVGMSEDVAIRACDPFFTTKAPHASGLGLSTVHSIVNQVGGRLCLSSTPGVGTTVEILLPEVDGPPSAGPPRSPEIGTILGHGEKVLVVEDSASLRRLVVRTLADGGYQVLQAASPSEALSVCEQSSDSVDLLLTDVVLPEMSGKHLAELLAQRHDIHRVGYVSGYDVGVLAQHGTHDRGTQLLEKPFLGHELLRFVRRVLDEGKPPK